MSGTAATIFAVTFAFLGLLMLGALFNIKTAIDAMTSEIRRQHGERIKVEADREQRDWHRQKDAVTASRRGSH